MQFQCPENILKSNKLHNHSVIKNYIGKLKSCDPSHDKLPITEPKNSNVFKYTITTFSILIEDSAFRKCRLTVLFLYFMSTFKHGFNRSFFLNHQGNENALSRKLLVHMVVTCSVTLATRTTFENGGDLQQKPDKETQELEKEILGKLNAFLRQMIGP